MMHHRHGGCLALVLVGVEETESVVVVLDVEPQEGVVEFE